MKSPILNLDHVSIIIIIIIISIIIIAIVLLRIYEPLLLRHSQIAIEYPTGKQLSQDISIPYLTHMILSMNKKGIHSSILSKL